MLAHRAGATHFEDYPDLAAAVAAGADRGLRERRRPLRPARVAAIALNTRRLDEDEARAAIAQAEDETGLTADDLVRFGADRVLDAVLTAFQMPT